MEEATQAFVFFWLAGLFVVLGAMLAFFSKVHWQRRLGGALFGSGLLSLMLTPWTLPFSPSSAFGHLLGSLVGPAVLLGVGLYQIAFSGHVPVGRLSRTDRTVGIVMVVVGVLWLEAMHWWVLTPTYPNEVNKYWYISGQPCCSLCSRVHPPATPLLAWWVKNVNKNSVDVGSGRLGHRFDGVGFVV